MIKRPPGRPPLDVQDRSISVSITLTTRTYDALCKRARRAAVSIGAIVRQDLRQLDAQKKLKTL